MIGLALSMTSPIVTLHELQTVYSLEDLYDMVEVYMVNMHNNRVINKPRRD